MTLDRFSTEVTLAVVVVLLIAAVASVPTAASTDERVTGTGRRAASLAENATDPGPPGGSLVIVGGSFERHQADLWNEIVDLGGGDDAANVVIVPAASGEPATAGEEVENIFESYGVADDRVSVLPIATEDDPNTDVDESAAWYDNANNESVVDRIQRADVVYFVGGAQHRIINALRYGNGTETPVGTAIRNVYERGGVLAGSSAGAAIMSEDMIGAGQSFDTVRRGVSYQDTYASDSDNRAWLTRGMGYFEHGMIDQHFQQRGRIGRLLRAMWHRNEDRGFERTELGFGVDEGTALVTNSQSSWIRVLGKNYVTVVDLSEAEEAGNTSDRILELEGIQLTLLSKGDAYNVNSGDVRVAEKKNIDVVADPYYGNAPAVSPFAKNGLRRVVTVGLVDNKNNEQVDAQVWKRVRNVLEDRTYLLGMVFTVRQTDAAEGYFGDDDYADKRNRYLVSNVTANLSVQKVPMNQEGGSDSTPTPRLETVTVTVTVDRTVTKTVFRTRTPAPTTTGSDSGSGGLPGFGPIVGIVGLLGALGLLRRGRNEGS